MARSILSAPYRALRKALLRIPHPLVRRGAAFLLMFFVSLAIGRAVETTFSKQSVEAVLRAQKLWIAKVEDLSPMALMSAYLEDYGPASRGEYIYRRTPTQAKLSPEQLDQIAAYERCRLALAAAPVSMTCEPSPLSGVSAAQCVADPTRPECASAANCSPTISTVAPPECDGVATLPTGGSLGLGAPYFADPATVAPGAGPLDPEEGARIFSWFAPLAALVRTLSRVLSGQGWEPLFGILQIGLGAVTFCLATFLLSNGRHVGFDHAFANIVGAPVAIIVCGSVGALALKWLMLGALGAFAWVTGLAAMAAGATGVAGLCWYCFLKLSEKGVEGVVFGR